MAYQIFTKTTCPFCQKVERFADKHQIDLDLLNIQEVKNEERLVEMGGLKQVPAMILEDETILYESNDIIDLIGKKEGIEVLEEDYETKSPFCPI